MNLGLIPLLLVALLMIGTRDPSVESVQLLLPGDHEITDHAGALIVGDAEVTVPAGAEVPGPVYLAGGELHVRGAVRGDVTQLAGRLVLEDGGAIHGELLEIGGTATVSSGASIARRSTFAVGPARGGPAAGLVSLALLTAVLTLVGARLARRRPGLLDTVGETAMRHPVVSLTVGLLLSLTALALFVFMAFTLVLIPVTVLGVVAGLATAGYAIVVGGHLLGRRIPVARPGLATGLGVVGVMAGLQVLGVVPLVGDVLAAGVVLTGIGAVVLTYFGLKRFQPSTPAG